MKPRDLLQTIRTDAEQGRLSDAVTKCLALLRREPRNVDAIALYGRLAMEMGRPADAIVILQKLLAIRPSHSDAHDCLAYLIHQQGDYANARVHALEALRLAPTLVEPHLILGSILLSEQKEAEALQQFDEARRLVPGNLIVEKAYVEALFVSGKFEQVVLLLRELIALHPEESTLYATLASSQKLSESDVDVTLIRSLADGEGSLQSAIGENPDSRAPAYMALYKVESDLGNYDEAFRYLQEAKDLRKGQQPFDLGATSKRFREEVEVFDADFYKKRLNTGCADGSPIFVVGMPRSGTTLLERVLSGHEDITAAGELPIVGRLREEACAKFGKNQYDLSALQKLPDVMWRQLGEEYISRARKRVSGTGHFVDKMPGNFINLAFIRLMLPKAKIIHLSRHPVANCLSIYEQDFGSATPFANDLQWLGFYYRQYRQIMAHWVSLFGDDIIELEYETLVTDGGNAVQFLGQRLGINLTTGQIEKSQGEGRILTASIWQARQAIHTDSIARWENFRKQLQPLLEELAPLVDV